MRFACPVHSPRTTTINKASKKDNEQWAKIEALASKMEPQVAAAFLEALSNIGDGVTLKQIADALDSGNMGTVMELLGLTALEQKFGPVIDALRNAIKAGGDLMVKEVVPNRITFNFDMLNQRTVDFVKNYEFNLIREVSDNTRKSIQKIINDGYALGQNPRATARIIKDNVGLTQNQSKWVANFRKELETFHQKTTAGDWGLGNKKTYAVDPKTGEPTDGILARRLRDRRYDGTLERAMTTGTPLTAEQIDKMVEAYRNRWIAFRAETIARSESLRAVNIGGREAFKQGVQAGNFAEAQVQRKWHTAQDDRVSPEHAAIPKMNPHGRGLDEPFHTPVGPYMFPPIRPNCRCTVIHRILEAEELGSWMADKQNADAQDQG